MREITDRNVHCFINVGLYVVTKHGFHRLRFTDGADAATARMRLAYYFGHKIVAIGYYAI